MGGREVGYLIPVDGDPASLYATAVSMDSLKTIARRLNTRHVLFVADACYSGFIGFNNKSIKNRGLLGDLVRKPAIQVLTAGTSGQQAIERDGNGLFTKILLQGLRGGADRRGWGWVELSSLGTYIRDRVYAESRGRQRPLFKNLSGDGDFVFVFPSREQPQAPSAQGIKPDGLALLLEKADGHIAQLRLTTPKGKNAYDTLQEILRVSPSHAGAIERLKKIASRYKEWAREQIKAGNAKRAEALLERAKKAGGEDPEIDGLMARLKEPPGSPQTASAGTGDLYIVTNPPGASVTVDGRRLSGLTPHLAENIPAGKRRLLVRKGETHGAYTDVELRSGDLKNLSLKLERLKGELYVKVRPFGAAVYLDGKKIGVSPLKKRVDTGERRIEVKQDGYRDLFRRVKVAFGKTSELSLGLAAIPRGTLIVTSTPSGAEVIIGRRSRGKTPRALRLYEGEYAVALKMSRYKPASRKAFVKGGRRSTVAFYLEKSPIPPGMVKVPAGWFIMGSNDEDSDEKPRHRVYLDGFYIDRYPVTNKRFRMAGMTPKDDYGSEFNSAGQPVVGVTWDQSRDYCSNVGKRLPTEAEWEKAARGTDGRKYPWGNSWDGSKLIWGQ
ncbi:MAG: PEGA domain-containing protein, partial [Nitrospinota bacterium]|nr:PEGA domain-containing protein [Nitrospinota bacterium]